MRPERRIGPRTRPTGYVPGQGHVARPPESQVPATNVKKEVDKALAARAKAAYIRERSRLESITAGMAVDYVPPALYDGHGPMRVEDSHGPVIQKAVRSEWESLASWCRDRDFHPELYVVVAFESLGIGAHIPEPKQLKTSKFAMAFRRYAPLREARFIAALRSQKSMAKARIVFGQTVGRSAEDSFVDAVTAGDLPLSPLFRYCLARHIDTPRLHKIASRLEPRAIMQFELDRKLYRKTWKEMIPKGFSKRSARLYPYLLIRASRARAGGDNHG